jgi:hypothetical protein
MPVWMFALYDLVLGGLCLESRKLLGAYPTKSNMVLVDIELRGWQGLVGLPCPRGRPRRLLMREGSMDLFSCTWASPPPFRVP